MKKFLRQVNIFSGLNDEELEILEEIASQKEYPKDSYIVREDDPGLSLFIIRSGAVDVVFEQSSGKAIHLSTLRSYEFFGEISLFDGKPRSATVVAREHSTIIEISRDILLTQISKYPDIALKILAKMSQRIRNLDEIVKRFGDQVYGQVSQKVEDKLAIQLDSVKTLYKATEERAAKTLDGVEDSWKRLWRLITLIVGVFTVFASAIAFFGYQKYTDIERISEMAKNAEINIAKVEKNAREADMLREVMLNIRKIREDLKLDLFNVKGYNPPEDESKNFAINFSLSKKELFDNYINKCEKVEPEVCLEAALTIIELQKISEQKPEREEIDKLSSALIEIIKKSPKENWRMQLRAQDELLKLTKKVNNYDDIIWQLKSLVNDKRINDQAIFNFALILANLDITDYNAKVIFYKYLSNSLSEWRRSQAAIGLLQMGEERIWYNISEILHKKDFESFTTAYLLGQLGRQRLMSLPAIKKLENDSKKELIIDIKKNIHEGVEKYYPNKFMKKYCDDIIKHLD